jgi:hypothetical protein
MKALPSSFSHINLKQNPKSRTGIDWTKPYPLDEILKSPPKKVASYDELVKNVAQLQHHNRKLNLFFRGQTKDYLDADKKSTILAGIFRKNPSEKKLLLKDRFVHLDDNTEKLRKAFDNRIKKLAGTHLLHKFEEVSWALLQHYQICPTPLIDISHSLHVASSFAYEGNTGSTGVVYVLGLPWPNDALSYSTYEELVNIRLLNICPPQAQRPFFQEGYLLGNFPNYRLDDPARVKQFDPARRIVAKFEIPINDSFWGEDFKRLPSDKLCPKNDLVKDICESI